MNIGDLFVGLKIDPSGDLKAAVTKASAEAGDAGAKSLSDRLKAGLGGTALKGAMVGIAGGLALATKGAVEAEQAQGKFMAATGASREEAKKFVSGMDSLAGSAGSVGMKFEDIAATGTMVEQQFGTTGQATTDLTEKILEFSKVSGVNATDAAATLEDTLSAFNLTSADAGPLMDSLVASSQKFGTNIGDSLPALQAMAPAMTAMNLSADDGVALLNAFEVAGVDAGSAASGLNRAVKTLKPGQDLDDLITQIGAIEDPTLRAQEAIKLFGKQGAALGRVIQPGMTSLDDFAISADEAAGKTGKAAEDMLTFGDRIRGFADKALAGAREIGNEFGPAVTGLSSLATLAAPFARGIGGMLQKMLPDALRAATAAGVEIGTAEAAGASGPEVLGKWGGAGKLAGAAFTAGAVFAVAAIAEEVGPPIGRAGEDLGRQLFGGIAKGMGNTEATGVLSGTIFDSLTDGLHTGIDAVMDSPVMRFNIFKDDRWLWMSPSAADEAAAAGVQDFGAAIAAHAASEHADFAASGATVGTTVGEAAAESTATSFEHSPYADQFIEAASTLADQAATAAKEKFDSSAQGIGSNLADALRSNKDGVKGAMDDLMWAIHHPLQLEKQSAKIEAELTSKNLMDGLNSKYPTVRTQAEQTKAYLISQWELLNGRTYPLASATSADLRDGLSKDYPGAKTDASNFVSRINEIMNGIKTHYSITANFGGEHGFSGGGRASGGPVRAGTMYRVNENTAHSEWFMPSTDGRILRDDQVSGVTVNAPITINGATDPESVGNVVRDKLAALVQGAISGPLDTSRRPAF